MTYDEEQLEALGAHVVGKNAAFVEETQRELELHFEHPPIERPKPRLMALVMAGVAAAAACAVAIGLWWTSSSPTPAVRVAESPALAGEWHQSTAKPRALSFDDGSTLVAAPQTRFQTTSLSSRGATITLERGELDVSVRHKSTTKWTFLAGPYEVEVTGTRFVLGWSPEDEAFELTMREGSVVVRGPGLEERRLAVGESLELTPPGRAVEQESPIALDEGPTDMSPELREPPVEPPKPMRRRNPRKSAAPTWSMLSRDGQYKEALEAADRIGFDRLCGRLPASELYELADMARFAGAPGKAKLAYEAIRERFPKHEFSSRAAFDLGVLSRGRASVDWFEAYLRERPGGPLAREALGRLLELHVDSGDKARARETARLYLERYPRGPHAKLARAHDGR